MATLSNIVASSNVVLTDETQTLTNKTINGANNTLTVRLANDVSGQLPATNGGTGLSLPGTAGNVLTSDGTGWVSSPTATNRAVSLSLIFG